MTRRRPAGLLLALAAAVALAGVAVLGASGPAPAAPATAVAWWTARAGGVTVAGGGVPDGGLYVAQGPQSPLAVAAVRATVPGGGDAVLILKIATGSVAPSASVLACPTTAPWSPVANGDLAAAPAVDLTRCTAGDVSTTGMTVRFDIPAAAAPGGALDVELLPQVGGVPYSLPLEAPGEDAVTAGASAPPDAPSATDPPADPGSATTEGPGALTPSSPGVDPTASPTSVPSEAVALAPPDAPLGTEAPPTSASTSGAGGRRPTTLGPSRLVKATTSDRRWPRFLAIALLGALVVAAVRIDRRPARVPRPVGRAHRPLPEAGEVPLATRGVGRHRRARSGTPPAI